MLLLLTLLGTGGASPPSAEAAETAADRQFTFAYGLMQRGEAELAAEAFERFIRHHGDDRRAADAHFYLAQLARQRQDLTAAHRHLRRVVQPLYVSEEALNLLRGEVELAGGDADAAVAALERVDPAKLPDAQWRARWAYQLALAYRRAGNAQAAERHFEMASEASSPVRGAALLELGKTRAQAGRTTAAIEALTEAVQGDIAADQAAEARRLAGDLAYRQQRYALAADFYKQIVQQHQGSAQFHPALIRLLRALDAAGADAELIEQHAAIENLLSEADRPEALYLLARAHVRRRQYLPAQQALNEFYGRTRPSHPLRGQVAYLYATCLYQTDQRAFEELMSRAEAELAETPHRHELRYLWAQAAVKQQRYAEAIERLTPLVEAPEGPYARRALLQRATLREHAGRSDEAAADYALYADRYGQDPKAAEALRRAISLAFTNDHFERVAEMAGAYLGRETIDPADRATVRFQLAVSQIKLGREEEALATLERLLSEGPGDPIASYGHYYRGRLMAARAARLGEAATAARIDAAVEALRRAAEGALPEPQQLEALTLTARLHRMAGRNERALAIYEKLAARRSVEHMDPLTAMWVGRSLYEQGRFEPALPWLSAVVEAEATAAPAARTEAMFLAARCRQELQRWPQAIETYRRLLATSRGYGQRGRLGLARSLAAAGRTEEALSEYDGLMDAESSEVAASALLDGALLRLELARQLESAGDAAAAQRERTEARKRLHRAVILHDVPQLEPIILRAMLTLGRLHAEAGRIAEAREQLDRIVERASDSPWRTAGRAERALLDGRRGEAVFLLRKMVEEGPSAGGGEVAEYARRRLAQLGEGP